MPCCKTHKRDETALMDIEIVCPADYFPLRNGRYRVAPAMMPLGTPFGNGQRDGYAVQIDREFPRYRASKLLVRKERFDAHVAEDALRPSVAATARVLCGRIAGEHPRVFGIGHGSGGATVLECRLTGEILTSDGDVRLSGCRAGDCQNALDTLASQMQEDFAVVQHIPERGDWIAALHVCAPSHWAPDAKIGQGFDVAHAPVRGMN